MRNTWVFTMASAVWNGLRGQDALATRGRDARVTFHAMTRAVMILTMLLATALVGGCGYTMDSPFPDDVRTVNVPIFQRGKEVFRRDIEFDLTEAVIKRLQQDTPYKLASRDEADTELTGEIHSISQQILYWNTDTGAPREMAVTFNVSFEWKDLRTGEIRAKRDLMPIVVTRISDAPFNQTFFQSQEDMVNKVAKRIVESLESEW